MSIAQELADILEEIDRPGDFFVAGQAELLAPGIEVDDVGPIALPLLPAQARQLIKAASRAPYGRGADTVVDTRVRRTWQIEAGRVYVGGKHWPKTLAGIVARAAEGLGVEGPVAAELYKLLVYDKGSFFVDHRDTEKSPGMFATLVIALPSRSTGGELVVRHEGREAKLDLASADPAEVAFAAFYADCVHEVLPVKSGCRATLVFNLVREGKRGALAPPAYDAEAKRIASLLAGWAGELADLDARHAAGEFSDEEAGGDDDPDEHAPPRKIATLLDHAYTPAELAFGNLKGTDVATAKVIVAAAAEAACDVHLALLTVEESGSAEYSGRDDWYKRRRRGDDGFEASDFEVSEVIDHTQILSAWRPPTASRFRSAIWRCMAKNCRHPTPSTTWNPTNSISTKRPATKARRSSGHIPAQPW